jgi:hypothetical protein
VGLLSTLFDLPDGDQYASHFDVRRGKFFLMAFQHGGHFGASLGYALDGGQLGEHPWSH